MPTVQIFNHSYIEILIPRGIELPSSISSMDEVTSEIEEDPWLSIPCEWLQSLDDTTTCSRFINLTYCSSFILTDTGEIDKDACNNYNNKGVGDLVSFDVTNLVRINNCFEGEKLEWIPPDKTKIISPLYPEMVPPWIDPDVDHSEVVFTMINGTLVDLDSFEIVGNKTEKEMDRDNNGVLTG